MINKFIFEAAKRAAASTGHIYGLRGRVERDSLGEPSDYGFSPMAFYLGDAKEIWFSAEERHIVYPNGFAINATALDRSSRFWASELNLYDFLAESMKAEEEGEAPPLTVGIDWSGDVHLHTAPEQAAPEQAPRKFRMRDFKFTEK
jgi:hypothetical protein